MGERVRSGWVPFALSVAVTALVALALLGAWWVLRDQGALVGLFGGYTLPM